MDVSSFLSIAPGLYSERAREGGSLSSQSHAPKEALARPTERTDDRVYGFSDALNVAAVSA